MGRKLLPPMLRKPKRFSLYGFEVGDGCVLLVDRNGQRVGIVAVEDIGMPSRLTMSMLLWEAQLGVMLHKFKRQERVNPWAAADVWERKTHWWMASFRSPVRKRSHVRFFSGRSRKTWDDALRCMRMQYKNAEHKAKVLKTDPWNQWAETVSRNHRRKGDGHGNAKRIARNDRAAAVQVCWDWCRVEA